MKPETSAAWGSHIHTAMVLVAFLASLTAFTVLSLWDVDVVDDTVTNLLFVLGGGVAGSAGTVAAASAVK